MTAADSAAAGGDSASAPAASASASASAPASAPPATASARKRRAAPREGAAARPHKRRAAGGAAGGGNGAAPGGAAAPRRALTPYFFWLREKREAIQSQHGGGLSAPEVAKAAGALWRAMDSEAKAPWEARAKADKERLAAEQRAMCVAPRDGATAATGAVGAGQSLYDAGGTSDSDSE